jgi:hypothetical protein
MRCRSLDAQADDYAKCAEDYQNQNIKAEQVCRANPTPIKPNAAVASRAIMLPKPIPLSQALRVSGLSGSCLDDFANVLGKKGFNMTNFLKDLPPAVVKVKLQMKSPFPFGKPKDGDLTSVGLTVGCIKALPESPAEIQSLLKNISLKAGLSFAANVAASAIESAGDDYDDEGDEYYYDPKKFDREASVVESGDHNHDKGYKKGKEVSKTTFGLSLIAITSVIITIILLAN